jgi:hypothetical protein
MMTREENGHVTGSGVTESTGLTHQEKRRVKLPGGWVFLSLILSMKRTPKLYGKILKKVAG